MCEKVRKRNNNRETSYILEQMSLCIRQNIVIDKYFNGYFNGYFTWLVMHAAVDDGADWHVHVIWTQVL